MRDSLSAVVLLANDDALQDVNLRRANKIVGNACYGVNFALQKKRFLAKCCGDF